eukprot:CAMPEP_0178973756 /NCGR_PEP_ID=MMETSP0789-20121207/21941_1 /TAXON_ID=3005 /ORGANISM="Rhizosolenia setigera, Strain CCMP 1694" /LENGTH=148 /DNA_ID=CAMNT_0020661741 /DNA_START=12 /DNA_END=458 /DNA_ORIENTATION=-
MEFSQENSDLFHTSSQLGYSYEDPSGVATEQSLSSVHHILYTTAGVLCFVTIFFILYYAFKSQIKKLCRKCCGRFKNRTNSETQEFVAAQYDSLDTLLFQPQSVGDSDTQDQSENEDLEGFADLMAESFAKRSKERDEMEKRFGQPLL